MAATGDDVWLVFTDSHALLAYVTVKCHLLKNLLCSKSVLPLGAHLKWAQLTVFKFLPEY